MTKADLSKTLKRLTGAGILLALVVLTVSILIPLPQELFAPVSVASVRVEDRRGIPLRTLLNDEQGRGVWKPLHEIAPEMRLAVVAIEDHRFRSHVGIDPLSVARAVWTNLISFRVRSGGSTLTQQAARRIVPIPRTFGGKLREAWYALRIERTLTKDEILEQYLNRAPFGNQLFGIEAAAKQYFDKSASSLSLAEAAFLAALPNAPTTLNPYRNDTAARERQRLVLRRMRDESMITQEEYDRAVIQPLNIVSPAVAFKAPHAVQMAIAELRETSSLAVVRMTIDAPLQSALEQIVRNALRQLTDRNVTNAAVVVIENATGAIRALIGSADFFDDAISGQVNGAVALRQPGSALKPFTYALAFESGMHPADIVADVPLAVEDADGDYVPENYDRQYHGPVRLRTALACSYNIPAVRLVRRIGKDRLKSKLIEAGFTTLTEPASHYGFGLTLGNADVRLLELTNAYASLARGGTWKQTALIEHVRLHAAGEWDVPPTGVREIFDERAAFLVSDILSDPAARRPAFGNAFRFPFWCAVKTGTTKDYRDNWTIGYTTSHTVGVWVGNFDGAPMRGVSGVTGAGTIFTDVITHVQEVLGGSSDAPKAPQGVQRVTVCAMSGALPGPACNTLTKEWTTTDARPRAECGIHRTYRIVDDEGIEVERVYQVYPEEYRTWVEEQRIPQPPPGAQLGRGPGERLTAQRLEILTPNDGDAFRLDPILRREYQAIPVRARIPDGYTDVRLLVDGKDIGSMTDGVHWWQLERGSHRLQLIAQRRQEKIRSRVVAVEVE